MKSAASTSVVAALVLHSAVASRYARQVQVRSRH